ALPDGALEDGRPVTFGIRPDLVSWSEAAEDGQPAVVAGVEPLGGWSLVTLATPGGRLTALGVARVVEGQKVMVRLRGQDGYLFDQASGLALGVARPAG